MTNEEWKLDMSMSFDNLNKLIFKKTKKLVFFFVSAINVHLNGDILLFGQTHDG